MYTVWTVLAMGLAVAIDLTVLRTRLVTTANFWITIVITTFFQIFVDGWLTRSEGTIVNYSDDVHLGIRVFYNSPVEDFGFGFAMLLLTLSVWRALERRADRRGDVAGVHERARVTMLAEPVGRR